MPNTGMTGTGTACAWRQPFARVVEGWLVISRTAQGILAGYVATVVMEHAQVGLIPVVSSWLEHSPRGGGSSGPAGSGEGQDTESSPTKAARKIGDLVGVSLTHEDARKWGEVLHWMHGITWAVLYSLLSRNPGLRSGLSYGAILWIGSDELLLWFIGAAKAPVKYSLKTHLKALSAHLTYGATLGLVSRGMRGRS